MRVRHAVGRGRGSRSGATPRGGAAEAWIVAFRAVQDVGGALMFPAAIAIVVATFDLHSLTWIVVAGAGMGLMLGQANTDAINRASRLSYGEATGVTQTVRTTAPAWGSPSSARS